MNNPIHHRSWILGTSRRAAGAALALAIMLVPAVLAPGSAQAQTYTESVLYSFTGAPDGASPEGSLVLDAKGNLYSTTYHGGADNQGTVFMVGATGKETVLYSFTGFTGTGDGSGPAAGLVRDSQGNLYGTTVSGGAYTDGTAFELDTAGQETVLHSFGAYAGDGVMPGAPLVRDAQGNLYGTTGGVDISQWGTVFEVDAAGNETVLYSFKGPPDGAAPFTAGLVQDPQGNLYGTTFGGGLQGCSQGYEGCGTVFKVDLSGNETVLYRFTGTDGDGANPYAGLLLDKQGNLYGTTEYGGTSGDGTVFELDTTGKETVLFSFNWRQASNPLGVPLADAQGNLYVTASSGGSPGCGAVIKLDTAHNMTVLYTFTGTGGDGAYPEAGLTQDAKGNLYGTTWGGGDLECNAPTGCGTVFKLTAAARTKTTTTLTSAPNPSTYGEAVTFTAVVAPVPPDGETVSFMKGKTVLGTGTLSGGTATFVTSTLKVGTTSVTAVYGGDSEFNGSKSKPVKQVVEK